MTSRLFFALFLTGSPALALPFTLRTPPAGLDFAATDAQDTQPPMTADFDRDGHRDWYWGGRVISRFPKSGTLTLPAITIPQYPAATVVPLAGAVLDVDQDGDMDIVRINRWNGWGDIDTLQVFLNDGEGAFTAGWRSEWGSPSFDEGNHFYQMVPGDYDRDGDEDIALLTAYDYRNYGPSPARYEGSLKILWNHTGQFGNSTMLQSIGFTDTSHLEAGDLDRDGDLDLICSNQTTVTEDDTTLSHLRTFINGGSGIFTVSTASAWTYQVLLRDVNRDGWADLLSNPGGSDANLHWQENNKTGGFKGQASYYSGGSQYPGAFALADANEDGILDLVIAEGPSLVMRPGQGNGYYGAAVALATLPSALAAIGADDLDQDGDQDFLLRFGNGTFRFLENRAPRLHPAFGHSTVALSGIQKLEVADMNRDGRPDVLALEPGDHKIHLLAGQSNGALAAPEFKLTANQSASDFTVADLNRDGRPDLAYTLPGSGQVRQVLQSDSIYFGWPDTKVGDLPGVSMVRAGDAASTNGSPDLMTASPGTVRWYVNNGSASAWTASDVLTGISPPPLGILPAPFNPRWGDIGYHLSADGALQIKGHQHFFGITPPWVQLHHLLQIHDQPQTGEMIAADLDRDGLPEIVFGNGDGALVWWKPTHQVGSTPVAIDADPQGTIRGLAAVDWNRDGRTDILCATTGGLALYLRNGNGWTREGIISNTDLSDVVAVDLDRDGRTDAVASAPGSGNLRLIYNRSQIVGTGTVALPSGGVLGLKPGQNGHAFTIPVRNPGRAITAGATHLAEPPIVVTGSSVRFFKADPNESGWKKGAAMTKSEVEQAVASVALVSNGQVIGSTGPNDVTAGGSLEINHHPVLGNLVPVAPDSTLDLHFRVTLKSTAANAAYTTFYLAHGPAEPATARCYEGGQFGLAGTFGRFAEARIEILPNLTTLQEWRQTHFGSTADSGNAANDHDHDGDGVPNLIEYVLGTNPKLAETATNAARLLQMDTSNGPDGNAFARLAVTDAVLADPKIRLTIEQTDTLSTWTTLAARTGGGAWTGVAPTVVSLQGFTTLMFNSGGKPSLKKQHFVRLTVDELP